MERKSHKTSPGITRSNATAVVTASSSSHHNAQLHISGTAVGGNRHHRVSPATTTHHANNNSGISHRQSYKSNNNKDDNNSISAIVTAKSANAAAGVTAASPEQLTAVSTKISARTKNEEAINDLRHRIPEIENIFDVHSRIGNGTFSTVLLGTLKKERVLPENAKRKFAIKHHIPTSHPDRIMKELQCMAKIGGSDNVVGINCCIRYNESVAFIMPYMPHDRFHDFFSKMDLSEVQHYMRNLLIALRHVHKFNVIHRDVKPSNFLYNRRKRQFLLVDFGLAQQVPVPVNSVAIGSVGSGLVVNGPNGSNNAMLESSAQQQQAATVGADGKRPREQDGDATTVNREIAVANATAAVNSSDISGAAKRLRCSGPNGDQLATPSNARITNSCGIMGGSPFKMPLKQLNEISTPSAAKLGATGSCTSTNSGICEAPFSRQVKSAIIGAANSRLHQQKLRAQGGQANVSTLSARSSGSQAANAMQASGSGVSVAAANDNNNAKYNTNRNLNASSGSKCFCYGNPQVCNICLIKKEIHASRAGTPGYRPPEVLLKYTDQTTAVDIWASGVIFLSILSSVYPFFKAPNDYVALAEMVTIFGDKTIRKTAFVLDRLVTLSQKTKPLDLRKLCVRFRNRSKFSSPELLKKYQRPDGSCEVCKNCDQFFFNCLCTESHYQTEPLDADDPFPPSAYDLLYRLLEVNPHKRITADEALKHPFFSEISTSVATAERKARD